MRETRMFDRTSLLAAIGAAAQANGARLEFAVHGGDALRLALKVKAMRITDPFKGPQEGADIRQLMGIVGADVEGAMDVLRRHFPRSAEDGAKQRFLLRCLANAVIEGDGDAPRYGR